MSNQQPALPKQQQGHQTRNPTPLAMKFSEAPPSGLSQKQQADWRLLWDRANSLRICFDNHTTRSTAYTAWQRAPAAPGRKKYRSVTAMSAQLSKATWDLRNLERIANGIPPVIGGAQEAAPEALNYVYAPASSKPSISAKVQETKEVANNSSQQDTEAVSRLRLLTRKEVKAYGCQAVERLILGIPYTLGNDDETVDNE